MRHAMFPTGEKNRFMGYEVPDDASASVTAKECCESGFPFTGFWNKCVDCGQLVSQWGYGNTRKDHGYRDLDDNYYCTPCGDKHRVRPQNANASRPKIEIEVPALYTMASLHDLQASYRRVIGLWPFQTKFLGILGIPGSGKSHCCWAIAKNMANQGRRVTIISAVQMREAWVAASKSMMGPEQLVHRWHTTNWLIIDDLSAAVATDGWVAFFHDLLDERINHDRPTMITTAAMGGEIEDKYSTAVRSRFQNFEWVTLPFKDWRAKKNRVNATSE